MKKLSPWTRRTLIALGAVLPAVAWAAADAASGCGWCVFSSCPF